LSELEVGKILGNLKQTIWTWLSGLGINQDELDQPNLRQQITRKILRLESWGPRGRKTLPAVVEISIEVGDGSVGVTQGFIDDPDFDREVEADLLNRLVKTSADELPVRIYARVRAAPRTRVVVREAAESHQAWLEIEGGDQHGTWYPITTAQSEWYLGRTEWHGDDTMANDVVLSHELRFVSRRAAQLRRLGSGLMIESLDQGDFLTVITRQNQRIRPTHVRGGLVRINPGDVLEFSDGGAKKILVRVHRELPLPPEQRPASEAMP